MQMTAPVGGVLILLAWDALQVTTSKIVTAQLGNSAPAHANASQEVLETGGRQKECVFLEVCNDDRLSEVRGLS